MSYAAFAPAFRRAAAVWPPQRLFPCLFLLLAVPVLVFSAVMVPAGEIPDEVAHIMRANSLLHGNLVGYRIPRGGGPAMDSGVTANPALIAAGFAFAPGTRKVLTADRLAQLRAVPWAPRAAYVAVPNTAVYMPILYAPAAFGLGLGHLAGLQPYDAIVAARLCNALAFSILALLALSLARGGRGVLFAVLLLPMTLSLAASCNQDGLLIATAALSAALLSRSGRGAWWAGAAALGVVLAVKPLYLPLAGLVGLAAPRRLRYAVRAAGMAVAAVPALVWYGVAQAYAVVPFVRGAPYTAGPLWPGTPGQMFAAVDPAQQIKVFLHDPLLLLRLPFEALRDTYELHGYGVVGVLGTLDILLPPWLYALWYFALAASAAGMLLARRGDAPGWGASACAAGLACVAAALFTLFDGQYLSWTPIGAAAVEGIQGRYAIPLLPFFGLVLPRLQSAGTTALQGLLQVPAVVAAGAGLAAVPALLTWTYYLR